MAKATLVVDNRESKIKTQFPQADTTTYENLELGDFVIRLDNADFLVFERKTIPDLAASIKDGRYADQKQRLLAHYDPSKVFTSLKAHLITLLLTYSLPIRSQKHID